MLKCKTIGQAWLKTCQHIFTKGQLINDGDQKLREMLHFALEIKQPSFKDKIIEKYGDKQMIDWMLSNFLEQKRVPELKNALSYGTRLFNYNGKDQIQWVINKLNEKRETKGATIPLILQDDESYIPCVSALDFKIRDDKLMITAFCRSIDFGKKAYANMVALHKIQQAVAEKTNS